MVEDIRYVLVAVAGGHHGTAADPDTAGDIFYLEILGRKIVIVNNYDMANELMDKRSANYSDRPQFPLFMK